MSLRMRNYVLKRGHRPAPPSIDGEAKYLISARSEMLLNFPRLFEAWHHVRWIRVKLHVKQHRGEIWSFRSVAVSIAIILFL